MIAKTRTMPNVELAKELVRRMGQPTAQDRIGLARAVFAILKQEGLVNGEAKPIIRVANRAATALKAEFGTTKGMEAASLAGGLLTFAGSMRPFGTSKFDLMGTPCMMG